MRCVIDRRTLIGQRRAHTIDQRRELFFYRLHTVVRLCERLAITPIIASDLRREPHCLRLSIGRAIKRIRWNISSGCASGGGCEPATSISGRYSGAPRVIRRRRPGAVLKLDRSCSSVSWPSIKNINQAWDITVFFSREGVGE